MSDPILGNLYGTFVNIVNCGPPGLGNSSFCCSSRSHEQCCGSAFTFPGTGRAFQPGIDAVLQSLSSIASTTTISAGIPTSTASIASQTSTASKSSVSLGTAVGAGIGVPMGLLVVGALGFLFWNQKRKRATVATEKSEGGNNNPVQFTWPVHNSPAPEPTFLRDVYGSYPSDRGRAQDVELDGTTMSRIHEMEPRK